MPAVTRLLISVRNSDEARDAVEAGADLIDIKEPRAGPLGAAAPETIAEIVRVVGGRCPLSVALGELTDDKQICIPPGVQFAKLGLAGTVRRAFQPDPGIRRLTPAGTLPIDVHDSSSIWRDRWEQAIEQFPTSMSHVAVVYADFETVEAPPPAEVIECGRKIGCRAMLIDTFDKRGPGLLGNLSIADIKRLATTARDADMLVVFGGQVTSDHLPDLLPLAPDYIAVRGAVCRGSRAARLDPQLVERFVRRMRDAQPSPTR
jgi:(5-formylfuran-3-yl)methyl phosphate synthase